MSKKVVVSTIFAFFIIGGFVIYLLLPGRLFHGSAKGSSITSSDQIFSLSEKDIDLSMAILVLSSEAYKEILNQDIDVQVYKEKINALAQKLEARIRFKKNPEEIIFKLNKLVFSEEKFEANNTFIGSGDILRQSLVSTLDTRQGNCLGMSLVYLNIGERVGFPLYGVMVPGHVFVRYESNGTMINIETTSQGATAKDNEFYLKNYGQPSDNSCYLKNMTKREVLGVFLAMLALDYRKARLFEKAEYYLKKSIEMNARFSEGFVNLGRLYFEEGRYDEAIGVYRDALMVDPDDFNAHFNLANTLSQKKRYNEAIDEYARSVRCPLRRGSPDFADAYYNWALVYSESNMPNQEILQYKNALIINPSHYAANSNLSTVYIKMGMFSEARQYLEKAISINPGRAQDHYSLGVIYFNEYRTELAIKEFVEAQKLGYRLPLEVLQVMDSSRNPKI